jgi:hypothetical protein
MAKRQSLNELFRGRHVDQAIIIVCVRWYLRSKLSFRDLVEMMAERGLTPAHTTILRWVQRYVPEFEKRWHRFARNAGSSWRVDETYVRVRGTWLYLYRAVDREGKQWISDCALAVTWLRPRPSCAKRATPKRQRHQPALRSTVMLPPTGQYANWQPRTRRWKRPNDGRRNTSTI